MRFTYVTKDRKKATAVVDSFSGDNAKGKDSATSRPVRLLWNGRIWKEV